MSVTKWSEQVYSAIVANLIAFCHYADDSSPTSWYWNLSLTGSVSIPVRSGSVIVAARWEMGFEARSVEWFINRGKFRNTAVFMEIFWVDFKWCLWSVTLPAVYFMTAQARATFNDFVWLSHTSFTDFYCTSSFLEKLWTCKLLMIIIYMQYY